MNNPVCIQEVNIYFGLEDFQILMTQHILLNVYSCEILKQVF